MKTKAELRKDFSKSRSDISEVEIATKTIMSNIESLIHNMRGVVGIYLPIENEIDISLMLLKYPHRKFALPKIIDDEMCFVKYSLGHMVQDNPDYPKIKEPKSNSEVIPEATLVPAIAYDIKGNRLGRGKGHYDKYFAKHGDIITKVGVSFNAKIIENLPRENHDCRMDYLVSEDWILKIK
jgi:5-formyltetrahydrofolate cyclo-ligase